MKKIISIALGFAVGVVLAAEQAATQPEVQVVKFSTQGQDLYADKSPVLDGECYALVWSEDGQFEGIDGSGNAKDPDDKVVFIGEFAKGGKCGQVEFHVANDFKSKGSFDVWVLDTRVFDNGEVIRKGKAANGSVIVTHAQRANEASVAVSSALGGSVSIAGNGSKVVSSTVDPSQIAAGVKISNFKVDGDYVVLDIASSVPGANYSAIGAATPDLNNPQTEGKVTTGTGGTITVVLPKVGDRGFFKGVIK